MIDSCAFTKIEMQDIVGRLIGCCVAEDDKKNGKRANRKRKLSLYRA